MRRLYTILIATYFLTSCSLSFAASDKQFSVRTRDSKNLIFKMCQQASDILKKIQAVDRSVSLDIDCLLEEDFVTNSFMGFSNTIEYYNVRGEYSGDVTRACEKPDAYKIIRAEFMMSHYSSKTGMPSGMNPFLKDVLNKLGVRFEYTVKALNYEGRAPMEILILYPSC